MTIESPRLGITSITTDHDGYAVITTTGTSHTVSSLDLRLLARDLVAMADEIDNNSPSQDEIALDLTQDEIDQLNNL